MKTTIDRLVAPRQEDVQQQEEPLGEILHRLGHRARHVHQAEHHRLGVGLRHALEAVVAHVDRIDIGDAPRAPLRRFEIELAPAPRPRRRRRRARLAPAARSPRSRPGRGRCSEMRRARLLRMVRRRLRLAGVPSTEIAGARQLRRLALLEPGLDQIGQLEILEEEIEELLLREHELEGVLLAIVVGARLAAAAAAAARLRPLDLVAGDEFLVAGNDVVALAAAARRAEHRLGDAAGRDRDLLAAVALRRACAASARRPAPRAPRRLARSMKRCRLARLLPLGLGRRSMMFIGARAPSRACISRPC